MGGYTMIYIVAGFPRSGTSREMLALEAGGMEVTRRRDRQDILDRFSDHTYNINKDVCELTTSEYYSDNFPLNYIGKVVKIIGPMVTMILPHDYKILIMRRHPDSIRESFRNAFGHKISLPQNYDTYMDRLESVLNQRVDCKAISVDFDDVTDNPTGHFERLVSHSWPVDPIKAASIMDRKLIRA